MIPADGKLPPVNTKLEETEEQRDKLNHTYYAEPPHQLIGFAGNSEQPPFSTGDMVPKLDAGEQIVSPRPGKQPVYHVKITTKPVKNLQPGKKLTYRLTAGPTGNSHSGQTTTRLVPNKVHCIPEIAETGEPLGDLGITNLSESVSRDLAYTGQLTGIAGLEGTNLGALVHAYRGSQPVRTDLAMSGLLSATNAVGPQSPRQEDNLIEREAVPGQDKYYSSTIPRLRVPPKGTSVPEQIKQWWEASSNSLDALTAEEQQKLANDYSNLIKLQELKYGRSNSGLDAPTMGEGINSQKYTAAGGHTYSKVIPGLVDSEDQEKHTVYNWIVPDEQVAAQYSHLNSAMSEGVLDTAKLDNVPFQRGYTGPLLDFISRTRDQILGEKPEGKGFSVKNILGLGRDREVKTADQLARDDAKSPPLHFQDSEKLAEFLENTNEGMVWEQPDDPSISSRRRSSTNHPSVAAGTSHYTDASGNPLSPGGCCGNGAGFSDEESDDEPPIKPSIVYGGVEHDAPRYAGELGPLTMRLHATEIHQYIKVDGMPEPWFMLSQADPAHHAIHGPVILPWDPKYTGMPAPTVDAIKKHGYAAIDVPPAISQWFDSEIPAEVATGEHVEAS